MSSPCCLCRMLNLSCSMEFRNHFASLKVCIVRSYLNDAVVGAVESDAGCHTEALMRRMRTNDVLWCVQTRCRRARTLAVTQSRTTLVTIVWLLSVTKRVRTESGKSWNFKVKISRLGRLCRKTCDSGECRKILWSSLSRSIYTVLSSPEC